MRVLFFFLILSFWFSYGNAQLQGCRVATNTTNIYITNTGASQQISILCPIVCNYVNIYNNPLSTVSPSCPRAVLGTNTFVECYANATVGTIYNYQQLDPPLQCPLDDFLLFLVVVSGVLGILSINKHKSCVMM